MDNNLLKSRPDGFLIVGIGASAGGVQALKEFFQHVPANAGLAFVVILHLSPDHDSQLAHVLQLVSAIPVQQVTEKTKIEPDHVYVVPPNQHLILQDEFIAPSINLYNEERRAPVDIFFRTLADNYGPRAVCAVLSGTGANGSMGLKRIKEMGGVAFVQNPREAEFNEMPRNAIATELVDEVLPVAEIPRAILSYRDSIGSVEIPIESGKQQEQQQQALREIFTQLRVTTGHDFSNYKRATLLRRIERRINIHNLPSLPAYAALIAKSPDETTALLKDLLISVTNFFRDEKPFQSLEREIVPAILQGKTAEDEVRIWVAGCATGEEAYSIAMLFAEQLQGAGDAPKIQIFATDIDEAAIAIAREGFYTINDAADVSPERLRRFFNNEDDGYRVRREIREMVLFANHNFLKDPPFSRLNLITCRNVLIYLNHTAQERVVETFHFALKPGGFLFLGNSESVDGASDLYSVYSRENHIFQSKEVSTRHYPIPESVPQFRVINEHSAVSLQEKDAITRTRKSFGELHQRLLEDYAPPSVVINEEYQIVHMSEKVGRYFEFSAGEPSQNLLQLVRAEMRLELRTALYQAVQRGTAVEARNVKINVDNQVQSINLQIRPSLDDSSKKGYLLVIFQPNEDTEEVKPIVIRSDEPVAKQLEEELIRLKSHLRQSNEQHEYQQEELKAANEELQAMNEEMRSAAEELETSKEELQSINEELRTVNQELKVKIEEISVTSANLQNLINSANVGTIFLDRSFRTRLFTPAIREIFNLIPSDYGRPISDITNRLDYPDLMRDAETVLEKLSGIEREVTTTDNRYFLMRILPYRTSEDRINGVVITFFDISRRRETEQALRRSEEHLRLLIESAKDYAIFTQDINRRIVSWSTGAATMMGYSEKEIIGQLGDVIFTPEDRETNAPQAETAKAEIDGRAENERWHVRKNGSRFWGSGSVSPLRDSNNTLIGFVKIMRDLTESKEAEDRYRIRMEKEVSERTLELRKSREEYASLVENTPDVITRWDRNLRLVYANTAFEGKTGIPHATLIGKTNIEIGQPDDIAVPYMNSLRRAFENAETVEHYNSLPTPDGLAHYYSRIVPERNASGEVETVLSIARDITILKNSENELIKAQANLELALKGAHAGIGWWNLKTGEAVWDENGKNLIGFASDEESTKAENWIKRIHPQDRQKVIDVITACSAEAKDFNVEYQVLYENGEIRDFLGTGHFKKNEKGEASEAYSLVIDVTQRQKAEREIIRLKDEIAQNATDKYLKLFNSIHQGFCLIEVIFDKHGEAVDYRFLEANPAFEKQTGLKNATGRTIKELSPATEDHWFRMYGEIAKTRQARRFEQQAQSLLNGVWYEVYAFPYGKSEDAQVAVLFNDITQRKQNEEQQQYLLHLSDAMRPLSNARKIQEVASRILLEQLHASRVYYSEVSGPDELEVISIDYIKGMPDLSGLKYKRSDFGSSLEAQLEAGRTIFTNDIILDEHLPAEAKAAYSAWKVKSWASVPRNKQDKLVGMLTVHFREIHNWAEHELVLLRETSERTWVAVERAKAEEALRDSELRFRSLVMASSDSIYKMSADWRWMIELEGKNFLADNNYPNDSWIEKYIPEQEKLRVMEAIQKAIESKSVFALEHQVYSTNGSLAWTYSRAVPKFNEQGKIIEWIGAASNITPRKTTEEALRRAAERLQMALDAGKLGTYEYDFNTGSYQSSAQHKANFGFAEDDPVTLESLKERVVASDKHYMELSFDNALEKDSVYSTEYRTQLPDGSIRWIKSVGRFVYNDQGEPQKMVGITVDFTEEKMFTEELSKQVAERTKELQQSNNDLRQFAHVASHDLKEPVRKIQTFNSRALSEFQHQLPEKVKTYLEKIGSAAGRMVSMIDGVLRYSKYGSLEAAFEEVDLNEIIQNIQTDLEVLMQEKSATIATSNLPFIMGNSILIYQLFYNLVLNSLKFAKKDEATQIKITAEQIKSGGKQCTKIIISDNGIGFEQEFAETIFDTFTRLHSADEYEGTGLGLALCKKIVERHGGSITASGELNEGAVFTIILP